MSGSACAPVRDVALVLGASGGIGSACIRALADGHAAVVATSRRPPAEDILARENLEWVAADIASTDGRAAVVERVRTQIRPLASVVVASGIAHRGLVDDHSEADWRRTLDANVVGPALLLSALVTQARWADGAGVVLVGSLSARRALPARALYGASKAALEHFGRCLAVELAPRGISVNVVSAGVTDTPFLEGDLERVRRYTAERVPAGQMVQADEIAGAVAFALAAGRSLTAATIELDGGAGALG